MKLLAVVAALLAVGSEAEVSRPAFTLRQNPVATGLKSIDPRPRDYSCEALKEYSVCSIEDLKALKQEWECVFAQGSWPAEVPLGNWYGDVLEVSNTWGSNFIYEAFWEGKVTLDTHCNYGQDVKMGFNVVQGQYRFPFTISVGEFTAGEVDPAEYSDAFPSLMLDYTTDFAKLCPSEPAPGTFRFPRFASSLGNQFPVNTIHDQVRHVGTTPDGGNIWLGRVLATQGRPGDKFSTVLWFALRNYDSTTPLAGKASFHTSFGGVRQGGFGLVKDGVSLQTLQQPAAQQSADWNGARLNRLVDTPKVAALDALQLIRP